MGVNLIFRIAAVGILVSVLCQILKHSGRGGTGISHKSCGSSFGTVLDGAVYLSVV